MRALHLWTWTAALVLAQSLAAGSLYKHIDQGRAALRAGDFATAEREFNAALREVKGHPADPRAFLALEGLSDTAERQNQLDAAEQYLRQALESRERSPRGPMDELPALLDLKRFYTVHKRWNDGALIADRTVGIWGQAGFGAQAGMAQYLSAAGQLYESGGDHGHAEERYRAAVPILESTMGPRSAALALAIGKLAKVLAAEDKTAEAEAEFRKEMAMGEQAARPAMASRDYADFLRKHGREDEAAELEKHAPQRPEAGPHGQGATEPHVTSRQEPSYSEQARKARVVGSVVLYMEVDRTGNPTNIRVMEPLGFGLDEKAVEAVQSWRFEPGTKGGQPVTVAATIEVNFRLL